MSERNPDRSVKMIPAICTQCGGQVEVASTQRKAVCRFCGTTFFVTRDEEGSDAGEKAAARKRIWARNSNRLIWLEIVLCLIAFLFVLTRQNIWGSTEYSENTIQQAVVSKEPSEFHRINIEEAKILLANDGFTNIQGREIPELKEGQKMREGFVDYVSIGGNRDFTMGESFDPDTPVLIFYYVKEK